MAFHLQNVRTGETHSLNPHRNLIGTAPHATIPAEEGAPYLVALIVRYPGAWVMHGLFDDPDITFNDVPLRPAQQVRPQNGDVLNIIGEEYRFLSRRPVTPSADDDGPAPTCFAYIRGPDGAEECRLVDHDLLFGRLPVCHVRYPDTRLSRLGALLACHDGMWFFHSLSKGPIAHNRELIEDFVPVDDGDRVQVGPLMIRLEMREPVAGQETTPAAHEHIGEIAPASTTDEADLGPAITDEPAGTVETEAEPAPEPVRFLEAARRLEDWLKDFKPTPPPQQAGGISGWLGAQKKKLNRFWNDTPETTAARAMRTAGKMDEAFAVLDRAIRIRPDSPELLRELYRLYDAVGLYDLCYRPLRHIEKLAAASGSRDPWVLETLARVCERLGRSNNAMFERAIGYWNKLETVTGISYARERSAALASRAIRDTGLAGAAGEGS